MQHDLFGSTFLSQVTLTGGHILIEDVFRGLITKILSEILAHFRIIVEFWLIFAFDDPW